MKDLLEKHKVFRRLALVWAMCLITWVVARTFSDVPPIIEQGTAIATGSVTGLLATVIGFYKWTRHKDDERNQQ